MLIVVGNSRIERKGIRQVTVRTYKSTETKVGLVTRRWKVESPVAQRIKGTRDNRLIATKSSNEWRFGNLDVDSSHPGAEEGPKGLAVRQLKRYASWVQKRRETVWSYLLWAQDT